MSQIESLALKAREFHSSSRGYVNVNASVPIPSASIAHLHSCFSRHQVVPGNVVQAQLWVVEITRH